MELRSHVTFVQVPSSPFVACRPVAMPASSRTKASVPSMIFSLRWSSSKHTYTLRSSHPNHTEYSCTNVRNPKHSRASLDHACDCSHARRRWSHLIPPLPEVPRRPGQVLELLPILTASDYWHPPLGILAGSGKKPLPLDTTSRPSKCALDLFNEISARQP